MPEKKPENKEEIVSMTISNIADYISSTPDLQEELFGKILNKKEKEDLKNNITADIASRVTERMGFRGASIEEVMKFQGFTIKEIEQTLKKLKDKGIKIEEGGELTALEKKSKALEIVTKINELKPGAQTKEEYQQLTKLYQQLEKLYEGKEGQELEPWLAEQYESQFQILEGVGLLEKLKSGEKGIIGIDGKEYPFPTKSEIAELIEQNQELIEKKKEQGFTKLLLVPFGMKLDDLIAVYRETIIYHHMHGRLFASKKDPNDATEKLTPLPLNKTRPMYVWDEYKNADTEGKLVYCPESFDDNNNGKTKAELLKEQRGWNVLFIEDLPNIPRENKGKEVGDRKQLEANLTPKQYLQFLEQETMYSDEGGMTPEDQLMYAITHLTETDQVIDGWQSGGNVSYQIGGYFPASGYVPVAYWDRGDLRVGVDGYDPEDGSDDCGIRTAVRIRPIK